MGPERMSLDGVDVETAALAQGGGPLPTVWDGRPVRGVDVAPEHEWDGPLPTSSWRAVKIDAHAVLLAAPAREEGRWWPCWLLPHDGDWWAHVGWPEPLEPAAADLATAFELSWPEVDTWPLAALDDLRVQVNPVDPPAYAFSEIPARHVVGWLSDPTTGATLPHESHQVFGGYGEEVAVDAAGLGSLPVRWLVDGRAHLAPGRYAVRATLLSLKISAASKPITFT